MKFIEGFQVSSTGDIVADQERDCPMFKMNIDNNKKLLEKYKAANRVISADDTQKLIDLFDTKYKELSCDTYLASAGST